MTGYDSIFIFFVLWIMTSVFLLASLLSLNAGFWQRRVVGVVNEKARVKSNVHVAGEPHCVAIASN